MDKADRTSGDAIINLSAEDVPIFRVLDFNFLLDIFKHRRLILRRPSKWDDPFENVLLKVKTILKSSGEEVGIRGVLDIFFGQCWSDNPQETDATWRIYSPNSNGVRIATTVSSLFDSIRLAPDRATSTNVFLGKVKYKTVEEIVDFIGYSQNATRVILSADGRAAAEWLLIKRTEFMHESEVRLLLRDPLQTVPQYEPQCVVSVDPFQLIHEIVFDPRIPEYRFDVYRDQLGMLGVNVPTRHSKLYSLPKLCIEIEG
ncbi:MAG: DUF2971 domain-containing protein [Gammaproteobacteria bacterium]|nr:DUF2971 domain-containing protein [Gammaproteobacteria bacterium]